MFIWKTYKLFQIDSNRVLLTQDTVQHVVASVSDKTLDDSRQIVNTGGGPGSKGHAAHINVAVDVANVVLTWRSCHMSTIIPCVLMLSDQVNYADGKGCLLLGLWLHHCMEDARNFGANGDEGGCMVPRALRSGRHDDLLRLACVERCKEWKMLE